MPLKRLNENPFWVCVECESILRDFPISIEVVSKDEDEEATFVYCWSRVECDCCDETQYIQTNLKSGQSLMILSEAPMLESVKEVESREL